MSIYNNMYKVNSRWNHQDSLKVEWNIGKRCNMDCTYCPSFIHDNFSPHTDINVLKSTVDSLISIGKPLRISLTGGEPTIHPRIEELLEHMYLSRVSRVNITTNGTRAVDWYKDQPVSQYVFSLHFEFAGWDKIVDKIVKLKSVWDNEMLVHVMAHHDYMDRVKHSVKVFEDNEIPYVIRRVRWNDDINERDSFNDSKYIPQDLEWILHKDATVKPNVVVDNDKLYHANDIIKLHLNKYKGWQCSIGLESLMVNWDGEVHRATCRVGGSLGNIYKNTFIQPINNITCSREYCTCAADIPITKYLEKDI
jgi:MoaA/NifB/PqqE/SkfB family radical SAM enzyme